MSQSDDVEERIKFFITNQVPESPKAMAKAFYDKFQFKDRSSGTDSLRKTVQSVAAIGDGRLKHLEEAYSDPEFCKWEEDYFKERRVWSYDAGRAAKKTAVTASVMSSEGSSRLLDSSLKRTISTVGAENFAATPAPNNALLPRASSFSKATSVPISSSKGVPSAIENSQAVGISAKKDQSAVFLKRNVIVIHVAKMFKRNIKHECQIFTGRKDQRYTKWFDKNLVKIQERQAHTTRPLDELAVESTNKKPNPFMGYPGFIHHIRSQLTITARLIQEMRKENYANVLAPRNEMTLAYHDAAVRTKAGSDFS
ncbi:hypothetical protein BGZ46_003085 [Entomortierella lignicola]|nr:hypothetical protein BGZ46_003085 [Entomortierella lignicola]